MANLTNLLRPPIRVSKHQERFEKPNPATCRWRRQGALTREGRCAGERSSEQKISTEIPPPDEGRRFFVLLLRHPKHQPEERKTKSENTHRTRVVCGINRRSLGTDPREWLLPDGRHLRAAHWRSSPNNTTYDNWSTRGNVNPYTGEVGTRNDDDIRHYRGYRGYSYGGR
jgi:hypothetical protein